MSKTLVPAMAVCCSVVILIFTWNQSAELTRLQKENTLLSYKVSILSSTNERCDEQITQCWAWRSRMEIELKAYANDCKSWLRKQESMQ